MSVTEFARAGEATIAISIAVSALGPGKERSIVAFDRGSHFHIILTNTSDKPQRIASDDNSWGDHALSFEIIDESGKKSVAHRVAREYGKNTLHWWILQRQESVVMDVYFADPAKWEGFPHPGGYGSSQTVFMRAVFEVKPSEVPPADGLWTGRVLSKPEQYVFYNRMPEKSSQSEQWHGFPILPPITNADPSIRLPLLVHVPTKLKIERTTDMLSVEIDHRWLEATNLMVGTNMVAGVQSESYVFPEGEPRPAKGGYGLGGTDFNLGKSFWHTKQEGIPLPGKKYVVEWHLTVFETDVPPQHMWSPQGSKNYKVLWQRTLKQTVD